ncbi:DUF1671-domain-containing protein [Lindgomyces ingoldianus]|uniref:DUF1671-domain-containing protein n=1 Tax=Lindgomyces ingoldianus TaxID=673940 RepID=A0ACB6R7E3_9PLEO|nr:DUF1671-domain-containing protein [Lindgomyces ingoldianus]KAF2474381.1 DUF1671-domain-containing protein [Lindgomyces ingoldianus]
MANTELLDCPLCAFSVLQSDNYVLQLHFEQVHTSDSPFQIQNDPEPLPPALPARPSSNQPKHVGSDTPSEDEDENSVLCPEPDCGELVLLTDFNDHLDLHAAETLSFDEATGTYHHHKRPSSDNMQALTHSNHHTGASKQSFLEQNFNTALPDALRRNDDSGRKLKKKIRGRGDSSGSEKSTLARSILSFNPFAKQSKIVKPPPSSIRLGRAELGPHAWEDRMPRWLHDQLAAGPKVILVNKIGRDGRLIKQEVVQNETPGVIPILAQLSALDRSVREAYYCHPSTLHVGKTPKEGGFCGYRNIQMLISYIQGAHAQGYEDFTGRTPGILRLQDLIERAWDKGINEIGRAQTGGIRDTRKYIGTPEAQALFLSSQIDCGVEMFSDSPDGQVEAHELLLLAVERYFAQAAVDDGSNVHKTLLPPIYLQQPGHSLTIVGFERRKDGSCNLMIFDPMYNTSPAMHRLIGRKNIRNSRPEVLYAYRRVGKQLRRHAAFEILMLTAHPPLFPAWDVLRQFPDCRYLYVFFRSRTLGYDVYPEDHFLRNFPWQQYGGLWVVDDARFARSDKINPLTAQALRRLTSEGSSSGYGSGSSRHDSMFSGGGESFNSGSFSHSSGGPRGMRSGASTRHTSFMSSFDGTLPIASTPIKQELNALNHALDMLGMHTAQPLTQPMPTRLQPPVLSIQTGFGRKVPGYPTPISPTSSAKAWYPSPLSDAGSGIVTPRAGSPMSIDGSEVCGPAHLCLSHSYESYSSQLYQTVPGTVNAKGQVKDSGCNAPGCRNRTAGQEFGHGQDQAYRVRNSSSTSSGATISPTSPPRTVSPRTAMLKNMVGKQTSASPKIFPQKTSLFTTIPSQSLSSPPYSPPSSVPSSTSNPNSIQSLPSNPSIQISNGTETSHVSPISPAGTMLSYTSNRAPDSGLLAVKPLSEDQVAEYRFWRPCGRRSCAFGCGSKDVGEWGAARRLFKGEEEVVDDEGFGKGESEGQEGEDEGGKGGNIDEERDMRASGEN